MRTWRLKSSFSLTSVGQGNGLFYESVLREWIIPVLFRDLLYFRSPSKFRELLDDPTSRRSRTCRIRIMMSAYEALRSLRTSCNSCNRSKRWSSDQVMQLIACCMSMSVWAEYWVYRKLTCFTAALNSFRWPIYVNFSASFFKLFQWVLIDSISPENANTRERPKQNEWVTFKITHTDVLPDITHARTAVPSNSSLIEWISTRLWILVC